MPRAVILRFPRAAEAELLVRLLAGKDEYEPGEIEHLLTENAKIAAVVGVPARNAYCTCDIDNITNLPPLSPTGDARKDARRERSRMRRRRKSASKSRGGGWARSEQFGWWVCSRCSKPSKAMVTHFITCMLNGANDLTPEILGEGERISPQQLWEQAGDRALYDAGKPIGNGRRQRW